MDVHLTIGHVLMSALFNMLLPERVRRKKAREQIHMIWITHQGSCHHELKPDETDCVNPEITAVQLPVIKSDSTRKEHQISPEALA